MNNAIGEFFARDSKRSMMLLTGFKLWLTDLTTARSINSLTLLKDR